MSTPNGPDLTQSLIETALSNDVEKVKSLIKEVIDINAYGTVGGFQ